MKIKTSDLTGATLDWAVMQCLPTPLVDVRVGYGEISYSPYEHRRAYWRPSTDWSQGGPIIERDGIDLYCNVPSDIASKNEGWETSWRARYSRCGFGTEMMHGPTPLIAAMRCLVASKFGDEVEVPDELC